MFNKIDMSRFITCIFGVIIAAVFAVGLFIAWELCPFSKLLRMRVHLEPAVREMSVGDEFEVKISLFASGESPVRIKRDLRGSVELYWGHPIQSVECDSDWEVLNHHTIVARGRVLDNGNGLIRLEFADFNQCIVWPKGNSSYVNVPIGVRRIRVKRLGIEASARQMPYAWEVIRIRL